MIAQRADRQEYCFYHPLVVWVVLLLLIVTNAVLIYFVDHIFKTILICSGFFLKGVLVIDFLMGLSASPIWIRWPMLAYFGLFALLFVFSFI